MTKQSFFRFRIFVENLSGDLVGSSCWSTEEDCLSWYRGFIYGLNPNCNVSDYYPYRIEAM